MTFYVAGKYEDKDWAREVMRQLRLRGHSVVGDWTHHTTEGEERRHAEALLEAFAREDYDAVRDADALVLLHNDNCRGAFVELGIALGYGNKEVFVVGGLGKAPTLGPIFYYLPDDTLRHFTTTDAFLRYVRDVRENDS